MQEYRPGQPGDLADIQIGLSAGQGGDSDVMREGISGWRRVCGNST
jgi:hypothetical protein